mgnify:CR=1 FL=1
MTNMDILKRIISEKLNDWYSLTKTDEPPNDNDTQELLDTILNIIQPLSYIRWGHLILDEELHNWLQRMEKLDSPISYDEFVRIIHQPDFTIESYEISKGISIETEKQMDKVLLKKKYEELMND